MNKVQLKLGFHLGTAMTNTQSTAKKQLFFGICDRWFPFDSRLRVDLTPEEVTDVLISVSGVCSDAAPSVSQRVRRGPTADSRLLHRRPGLRGLCVPGERRCPAPGGRARSGGRPPKLHAEMRGFLVMRHTYRTIYHHS